DTIPRFHVHISLNDDAGGGLGRRERRKAQTNGSYEPGEFSGHEFLQREETDKGSMIALAMSVSGQRLTLRPDEPHPAGLAHLARLRPGLCADSPEVIGSDG